MKLPPIRNLAWRGTLSIGVAPLSSTKAFSSGTTFILQLKQCGDIADRRLYLLTSSGIGRAVVTIDTKTEPQYSTVVWETVEPALIVHRLCLDPAFQGNGFGRQLMDYVENYARRHRYASLRLDAYTGYARALAFYKERGYHEAGQVLFPRRELPFICFELDLER